MEKKESIPEIYTKSLAAYEMAALGLDPGEAGMLRVFAHNRGDHLCIHAARFEMSGPWHTPTMNVQDNAVGHQRFDLGGYYLDPERGPHHE
jgi:hypothetical protein